MGNHPTLPRVTDEAILWLAPQSFFANADMIREPFLGFFLLAAALGVATWIDRDSKLTVQTIEANLDR